MKRGQFLLFAIIISLTAMQFASAALTVTLPSPADGTAFTTTRTVNFSCSASDDINTINSITLYHNIS